jgi:hypothetical protein
LGATILSASYTISLSYLGFLLDGGSLRVISNNFQVLEAHYLALHEVPSSDHPALDFQKRVKLDELLLVPVEAL